MACAISKISLQNSEFKKKCVAIFNKRWKEFDTDIYMLAFFFHPKYRGNMIILLFIILIEFYIININIIFFTIFSILFSAKYF